jgi:hypothetical protein
MSLDRTGEASWIQIRVYCRPLVMHCSWEQRAMGRYVSFVGGCSSQLLLSLVVKGD